MDADGDTSIREQRPGRSACRTGAKWNIQTSLWLGDDAIMMASNMQMCDKYAVRMHYAELRMHYAKLRIFTQIIYAAITQALRRKYANTLRKITQKLRK